MPDVEALQTAEEIALIPASRYLSDDHDQLFFKPVQTGSYRNRKHHPVVGIDVAGFDEQLANSYRVKHR